MIKFICQQNDCLKNSTKNLRYSQTDGRLYCKIHINENPKNPKTGTFQQIPANWLFNDNGDIKLKCNVTDCEKTNQIRVGADANIYCKRHRMTFQTPEPSSSSLLLANKEPARVKITDPRSNSSSSQFTIKKVQDSNPSTTSPSSSDTIKKVLTLKLKKKGEDSGMDFTQLEALPVEAEFTLDELVGQIEAIDEYQEQSSNISLRKLCKNLSGRVSKQHHVRGISVADNANKSYFKESALIGFREFDDEIFLNLHEPFCVATFGLQGSGKSHSLSVIVENCLLSTRDCAEEEDREVIDLKTSMCCLVLHYDQSAQSVCEVTGLTKPRIGRSLCLPNDRMIVLVSPTYYLQRKAFYGPEVNVRPLLFKWSKMTADRLRKLMRLSSEDTQLYVATLLDILRSYQRLNRLPSFKDFISEVCSKADAKGQSAPLIQRLNILESFIHESSKNSAIQEFAIDVSSAIKSGVLVVADISDPLLSREEASGVFELLVESFRTAPLTGCGKLLALDEAHKFMTGEGNEGLDKAILDAARLMRHDGLRLVISTQSPKALNPEILELVSVAILHRFQSRDWFNYLSSKIELGELDFEKIQGLAPGSAIVYAGRRLFADESDYGVGERNFLMHVRPRITQDRGSSLLNRGL